MYSTRDYERPYLFQANISSITTDTTDVALSLRTAKMAKGYDVITTGGGDDLSLPVLQQLQEAGVRAVAIRALTGDHADIRAAEQLGIRIAHVPPYDPHAIAEHTVALMLALDRKLIKANRQVRAYNFAIDNLIGFNLHRKTVGIIGMGRVGRAVARILDGFGCRLLAYDLLPDPDLCEALSLVYLDLDTICCEADIISLHLPLNEKTRYIIDRRRIDLMKKSVMLINTSRGAVINTADVLRALEQGRMGNFGADVYEHEDDLFFHDYSNDLIKSDAVLNRFLELPNVLITPHQSFATGETLQAIADATYYNIGCFIHRLACRNELTQLQRTEIS
jgi:D-lactate dehydrogenase